MGRSTGATPARRASSSIASAKRTPWVVITRSMAVPPAPQEWQRQRSSP